jgi:hypothetical protein
MRQVRARRCAIVVSTLIATFAPLGGPPPVLAVSAAGLGLTELASLRDAGGSPDAASSAPSINAGGGVAFVSSATNVAGTDTNAASDVFLRTQSGSTRLISRTSAASPTAANAASSQPAMSHSGRFIAFTSAATDLVAGGGGSHTDVFLYDRDPNGNGFDQADFLVSLISQSTAGVQGVAASDRPAIDTLSGTPYVAFRSAATNLVTNPSHAFTDVYLRTPTATTRVSVGDSGAEPDKASSSPSIGVTTDTISIAFDSLATDLVPGDTNGVRDVFVRTMATTGTAAARTNRASVGPTNAQGAQPSQDPAISGDGTKVAFSSLAPFVGQYDNAATDIFVRDRTAQTTTLLTHSSVNATLEASGASSAPSISNGGRFVAFTSASSNLVPGDSNGYTDVFIDDLDEAFLQQVSLTNGDAEVAAPSSEPAVSDGGEYVAFSSTGALVSADTDGFGDVFLRTRDVTAPDAPVATPDAAHPLPSTAFSSDATPKITVNGTDGTGTVISGIAGFASSWNHKATSSVDKAAFASSLSSTTTVTTPALSSGDDWYFHVRARDKSGNFGPTTTIGPFKIDADGPKVHLSVSPRQLLKTKTKVKLTWSSSDAGVGPTGTYDVTYRAMSTYGPTGPTLRVGKKHTKKTSGSVKLGTATGYRFYVTTSDKLGHATTVYHDAGATFPAYRVFPTSPGWQRVPDHLYIGALQSTRKGARLTLSLSTDNDPIPIFIGLVTRSCATCGELTVYVGYDPKPFKVISLKSSTRHDLHRVHFTVPAETLLVRLVITSKNGKKVLIRGATLLY